MERINSLFVLGTWSMEKAADHSTSHWTNSLLKMYCFPNFLSLWLYKFSQRCPQKYLHNCMTTKWFVNCLNLEYWILYRIWKSLICNVKHITNLQILWNFKNDKKGSAKCGSSVDWHIQILLHHKQIRLQDGLQINIDMDECYLKISSVAIFIRQKYFVIMQKLQIRPHIGQKLLIPQLWNLTSPFLLHLQG